MCIRDSHPSYAVGAVTDDAVLLRKEHFAFRGGAVARRKSHSRWTDRDVLGEFCCGRRAPHAICLRERGACHEQQDRDDPKRAH